MNFQTSLLLIFLTLLLSIVVTATAEETGCCIGYTGNVDYDIYLRTDISDLTRLVNYLFITFEPLPCPQEANIDGDDFGMVDVSDITALVNHLFVTFEPTAACRPYQWTRYTLVETNQWTCYDSLYELDAVECGYGWVLAGQDAHYTTGYPPNYEDNGDGTILDMNTGLMWQKTPGEKVTYAEAAAGASTFNLAGYDDWRLPTIKELYSLIDFSGIDPSGWTGDTAGLVPFIDTDFFDFEYGDESAGERLIDAQYWSNTEYVSTTMNGDATVFGVNFADGRIKGYPSEPVGPPGDEFTMTGFVRYVRGSTAYGVNDFVDNQDGTVTDSSTGLTWTQSDSDSAMTWLEALEYAENLVFAGYDDWRLPNAKELHTIVDYTRSPATTGSAAIDPIFNASQIVDEASDVNWPYYWTSTTHVNMSSTPGAFGVYIAFGEALGYMESPPGSSNYVLMDVHGAGAQRSDPKVGDPADYPLGNGPQGDVVRIYNYVRCVRGEEAEVCIGCNR